MSNRSEGKRCHVPYRVNKNIAYTFKLLLSPILVLAGPTDIVHAMAGQPGGGGGGPQGPMAMLQSFLPLILIFVIFYFLLIRPQSKKAKEHKQMLEDLKKGDKVMTNGGIYGIIEEIDTETVTLKVGIKDDVKIKVNRSYIAGLRTKE
jgi:preprotein translocase subunit YajC